MSLAATPHASLAYAYIAHHIGQAPVFLSQLWLFEGASTVVQGVSSVSRIPVPLRPVNSAYVTGAETSPLVDANTHQCQKFNLTSSTSLQTQFTNNYGRWYLTGDVGFTLAWLQKFDTNGPSDFEYLYQFGSGNSTGCEVFHYDEDQWNVKLPPNKGHASNTSSLVPGTWQCVVFTYNASTRAYQFWINGVDGGSGTGPTGVSPPSATASIEFGPQTASGDEYWLQYFMVHRDTIWTQTEATKLYHLSLAPTLYEVSGVVEVDSSPAAREVQVYSVEGGYMINSGTSNATTGAYTISTFGYSDPVYVMAVGDTGERWLVHAPVDPVAS